VVELLEPHLDKTLEPTVRIQYLALLLLPEAVEGRIKQLHQAAVLAAAVVAHLV
jgi:hypothetical protein